MVIAISAKEVVKPEGSGLPRKTMMFESDEEDGDPEVKKQIEAVLEKTDLLGELILSDESESESSNYIDDEDLDTTKWYYEGQEEETGESGLKPSSPKAGYRSCCHTGECQKSNRFQARRPIRRHPIDQTHSHQGQGSQQ